MKNKDKKKVKLDARIDPENMRFLESLKKESGMGKSLWVNYFITKERTFYGKTNEMPLVSATLGEENR